MGGLIRRCHVAWLLGAAGGGLLPSPAAAVSLAITNAQGLEFGQVAASGTGGTVVMSPSGGRLGTGGVSLIPSVSGQAASFTVSGDALAIYVITLPTSMTLSSGTDTMTVDTFTSFPSGTGLLPLSGSQTLRVGATLSLGANQPQGNYSGSFTVIVQYE